MLKQHWQEKTKGVKSDEFVAYQNGRVRFRQRFQDIVDHKNNNRIAYHRKGLRMEIWSAKTGHLIHHGEYNEKCQKEGWGIEYDKENGNMVIEGIWSNGTLVEVIRCFNGDTMNSKEMEKRVWIQQDVYLFIWVDFTMMKTVKHLFVKEKVA